MNKIAIIPARGGSKRIPGKNIRDFCGQPAISYAISAALESALFDEVMVSTDDESIAQIARSYGAKVPFMRSSETAGDNASTYDVIKEVTEKYKQRGLTFNQTCCIYPTAVFIHKDLLIRAANLLEKEACNCVLPICKFSYPVQRSLLIEDDRVIFKEKKYLKSRSQDLEAHYHDAGMFYFYETRAYLDSGSAFQMDTAPLIIPETQIQDIDTETDWVMAELKYKLLKKGKT